MRKQKWLKAPPPSQFFPLPHILRKQNRRAALSKINREGRPIECRYKKNHVCHCNTDREDTAALRYVEAGRLDVAGIRITLSFQSERGIASPRAPEQHRHTHAEHSRPRPCPRLCAGSRLTHQACPCATRSADRRRINNSGECRFQRDPTTLVQVPTQRTNTIMQHTHTRILGSSIEQYHNNVSARKDPPMSHTTVVISNRNVPRSRVNTTCCIITKQLKKNIKF